MIESRRMNIRNLPNHDFSWTEIGLGCWQLGGGWGRPWDDGVAQDILRAAYESGTRFIDTADVYGSGESERSIGRFLNSHSDCFVATKLGRGGIYPDGYSRETLLAATRASLSRLGAERLNLTQLHCVPLGVLREGKVFDWLREQQREGLIEHFGASVESVEEGLICLEQEGLSSLQVIFNVFRQKPLEELLPKAKALGVAIIVRLPLASGLLAGKMSMDTRFVEGDHRHFNRDGAQFNVGETFAGLPYEKGVELANELKADLPEGMDMAGMSLRWILDHEAVTAVIPGASSPAQARANAAAAALSPLSAEVHAGLSAFYREKVREHIRGPY
jgi:aryl-alcohol dehydrogenase-like predicted oxidoreductase